MTQGTMWTAAILLNLLLPQKMLFLAAEEKLLFLAAEEKQLKNYVIYDVM